MAANYAQHHQQYQQHGLIPDDSSDQQDENIPYNNPSNTAYHHQHHHDYRSPSPTANRSSGPSISATYNRYRRNNINDNDNENITTTTSSTISTGNKITSEQNIGYGHTEPTAQHGPSSLCHSEDGQAPSTISFNSGCYSMLSSWKQKRLRQQQQQQQQQHPKAHSTLTATSRASSSGRRPPSNLSSYISSKLAIKKPKRTPLGLSQHYVTDSRRRRRANELILKAMEARRRLMVSPTSSMLTTDAVSPAYSRKLMAPPSTIKATSSTNTTAGGAVGAASLATPHSSISNINTGKDNSNNNNYNNYNNSMTSFIRTKSISPTPAPETNQFPANSGSNLSESPSPSPTPSSSPSAIPSYHHRDQQRQQQELRQHQPQPQRQRHLTSRTKQHHLLSLSEPPLAEIDDSSNDSNELINRPQQQRHYQLLHHQRQSPLKLKRPLQSSSNISISPSSSKSSSSTSLSHLVTDEQRDDLPDCIMRSASSLLALQKVERENNVRSPPLSSTRMTPQRNKNIDEQTNQLMINSNFVRQHKRQNRSALRRDSMRRMRLLTTTPPTKQQQASMNQQQAATSDTYGQNLHPRGPLAAQSIKDQRSPLSQVTKTTRIVKAYESKTDDDDDYDPKSAPSSSYMYKQNDEVIRPSKGTTLMSEPFGSQRMTSNDKNHDRDQRPVKLLSDRPSSNLIFDNNQYPPSKRSSSSTNKTTTQYQNYPTKEVSSNAIGKQQYSTTPTMPRSGSSIKTTGSTGYDQYEECVTTSEHHKKITDITKTTVARDDELDHRASSTRRSFIEEIVKNRGFQTDEQRSHDYVNFPETISDEGKKTSYVKSRPYQSTKLQSNRESPIEKGDTKQTTRQQRDTSIYQSNIIKEGNRQPVFGSNEPKIGKERMNRISDSVETSHGRSYTEASPASSNPQSPIEDQHSRFYQRNISSKRHDPRPSPQQTKNDNYLDGIVNMPRKNEEYKTNIRSAPVNPTKNKSEISKTKVIKASSSIFNDGQDMSLKDEDDVRLLLDKMTPNSVLNVKTTTTVRSESEGPLDYSDSELYHQSGSNSNMRSYFISRDNPEKSEKSTKQQSYRKRHNYIDEDEHHPTSSKGSPVFEAPTFLKSAHRAQSQTQNEPKVSTIYKDKYFDDLKGNSNHLLRYARTAESGSSEVLHDEPGYKSTVERSEKSLESYRLNETKEKSVAPIDNLRSGPYSGARFPSTTANVNKEPNISSSKTERDRHEFWNTHKKESTEELKKFDSRHEFQRRQTSVRDIDRGEPTTITTTTTTTKTSSIDEQLRKLQIIKDEIMGVGGNNNRRAPEIEKRNDFISPSSSSTYSNVKPTSESKIAQNKMESASMDSYANYDYKPQAGARYGQQRPISVTTRYNSASPLISKIVDDKQKEGQWPSTKKQTVPASSTTASTLEADKYQSSDTKKPTSQQLQQQRQQSRLAFYESALDNHDPILFPLKPAQGIFSSDTSIDEQRPEISDYRSSQAASTVTPTNPERIDYSIKFSTSGQPLSSKTTSATSTKESASHETKFSSSNVKDSKSFPHPDKLKERFVPTEMVGNNNVVQTRNNYTITSDYNCGDHHLASGEQSGSKVTRNDDYQQARITPFKQKDEKENVRSGTTSPTSHNIVMDSQLKPTIDHSMTYQVWSWPSKEPSRYAGRQDNSPSVDTGPSYTKNLSSGSKPSQAPMVSAPTPSVVSYLSSSSTSSAPANSKISHEKDPTDVKQPLSSSAVMKLVVKEKITPRIDHVQQPNIMQTSTTDGAQSNLGQNEETKSKTNQAVPAAIVAKRALYSSSSSPSRRRDQQHSPSSASEQSSGPQSPVYTPTSGFSNDSALASSVSSHSPSSQATTASTASSSEDNCSVTSNENGQGVAEANRHHMVRQKLFDETQVQSTSRNKEGIHGLHSILRNRSTSLDESRPNKAISDYSSVRMIDCGDNDDTEDSSSTVEQDSLIDPRDNKRPDTSGQKPGAIQMLPALMHQEQGSSSSLQKSTQPTSFKEHIYQQQQQHQTSTHRQFGASPPLNLMMAMKKSQSQENVSTTKSQEPQLVTISQQQLSQPKRVHFNDRTSIRSFESLTSASVASNEDGQDGGQSPTKVIMGSDQDDVQDDDHEDYGFLLSRQPPSMGLNVDSEKNDNQQYSYNRQHSPNYLHEPTGGNVQPMYYQRSPSPSCETATARATATKLDYDDEDDDDYAMRLRAATQTFSSPSVMSPQPTKQDLIMSSQFRHQLASPHSSSGIGAGCNNQRQNLSVIQHVAVVEPLTVMSRTSPRDSHDFHIESSHQISSQQQTTDLGRNDQRQRQSQQQTQHHIEDEDKAKRCPVKFYTAV